MTNLFNEEAVQAASPETLIEEGYALAMRGIYRLKQAGEHKEVEDHLHTLVRLFREDWLEAKKINR